MKKKYNYKKPIIKSYELKNEKMEIETGTEIETETKSGKRFFCFKSISGIIDYNHNPAF